MKALVMALLVSMVATVNCHARAVQSLEMKALMKDSALVFAGRVKSVARSGMTTELSYPTWDGATFEWLKVDVEVVEPIKGVKKGEVVTTMMLSQKENDKVMIILNPPGMVEPKVGTPYLCCLLPMAGGKAYAPITAPFDDNQSVFLLDRNDWVHSGATYYKDGKEVAFQNQDEKNAALWNLVNARGQIQHAGAGAIRQRYRAEIATPAAKDSVIHLKWKKVSARGVNWNEPEIGGEKAAKAKSKPIQRTGPPSK